MQDCLLFHVRKGHSKVAHMGLADRGSQPRHCSRSAWPDPVEPCNIHTVIGCHLVVIYICSWLSVGHFKGGRGG